MGYFALASILGWVVVVGAALLVRGRFYATFAGVILFIHTLSSVALFASLSFAWPVVIWLQVAVFVHLMSLVWARMRPLWFRYLFSIPGSFFAAGSMLALPWAVVAAAGFDPWVPWLPYAISAIGVFQSLSARVDEVDVHLDGSVTDGLARHAPGAPENRDGLEPLRIVQITDPHLGPFMSVERLARFCERAVAREPDLILLTGDFLTMESQRDPELLAQALAPLAEAEGKTFACFGNHDHEAPGIVRRALAKNGVRLLVDDEAIVETRVGPVQLVGFDFRYRDRDVHLREVTEAFPRQEGHLRLLLLHDPGAFRHLPEGEGDLVFSGHTHGGQVGLVSLGLPWTFVSGITSIPDHGLWSRGPDRLYVHRGTGHYGFPLRLGVPAEESLVRVWPRPS